ncbi:hypothetical protein ACFQE1_00135 [Halobium palmae]|uniref:Uncharacterized protein n=1 Tax=Halobium palmae TaxID=1776492 RepID=A0ABD5RU87_9EURY
MVEHVSKLLALNSLLNRVDSGTDEENSTGDEQERFCAENKHNGIARRPVSRFREKWIGESIRCENDRPERLEQDNPPCHNWHTGEALPPDGGSRPNDSNGSHSCEQPSSPTEYIATGVNRSLVSRCNVQNTLMNSNNHRHEASHRNDYRAYRTIFYNLNHSSTIIY